METRSGAGVPVRRVVARRGLVRGAVAGRGLGRGAVAGRGLRW